MAWLNGFSKRLKLTIQPDNVDSSLTDFPVMINLSSSAGKNDFDATAVFDELGDDHQKRFVITKNDGTTQCPVEIEYWDATEEKAVLWTKIPTVYSSVDTDIYLYYDATYSGTATISGGNTGYVGDINDTTYEMIINKGAEGTYDTTHVHSPCVIKESDTSYKMWYTGYDGTNYRILYATSTNGITWTGHQMVVNINQESVYDVGGVRAPCVIKESDTSYKMWYGGADVYNYWRVLYATSTNGITWTNHQMVINNTVEGTYDTINVLWPTVIKEFDTSYKMWYSGTDGTNYRILYATSTNGINWTGHQMVVNIGAEGTYDTTHVRKPCVIKESDTSYKMWYAGHDGTNYRIMYAISTNGTIWGNFEMVLNINSEGVYDTTHAIYVCVSGSDLNRMWYSGYDGTNYRIMHSTYWKNPAQGVWDDNFKLVMHMSQDPSGGIRCIKDSTSNVNNGTPAGAMTTADLVDGKVGKGIEFDGVDDHFDISTITIGTNTTFSWIAKSDITGAQQIISGTSTSKRIALFASEVNFVFAGDSFHCDHGVAITDWHVYTIVRPLDITKLNLYVDGYLADSDTNVAGASIDVYNLAGKDFSTAWLYYKGLFEETRFSNIARSAAWIKATYHSNWDNLLIFQQEEEITTNWLTDWSKRIKLTIDKDKIDSTLVDFPVAVTLASGINTEPVFDELLTVSGTKKIAITTEDGTNQCYVEIERWDWAEEEANLWTKVPVVYNDEDTILYLYYDKTKSDNTDYVGDTGDSVAQNVWNNNFVGVWHMTQDPSGGSNAIKDSTSYINHGTSSGTMTPTDLVDGKIGKAIDFDGNNDNINCGDINELDFINEITVEGTCVHAIGTLPVADSAGNICRKQSVSVLGGGWSAHKAKFYVYLGNHTIPNWYSSGDGITSIDDGNYHYMVGRYNGIDISIFVDSIEENHTTQTGYTITDTNYPDEEFMLGACKTTSDIINEYWDGIIDEVRISNIARSAAWIKATYHSNWNNLITYGFEQERPIFLFNGYVQVEGFPAARTVYLYKRSDGELVGDVISNSSTGYFEIGSHYNEYHYVVILPELTETYNLLSYDKIEPGT